MTYDYAVTEVIRVVDGDTIDLRIDLGFHMTATLRFRILGLDTPERGEDGWAEATEIAAAWLRAGDGVVTYNTPRSVRARTYKADSFGRWLADIYDPTTGAALATHVIGQMLQQHGIDCTYPRKKP